MTVENPSHTEVSFQTAMFECCKIEPPPQWGHCVLVYLLGQKALETEEADGEANMAHVFLKN